MILKRLKESEDFAVFHAEIEERIVKYSDLVLNFHKGSARTELGFEYYLNRLQGLKELMSWLDDEIESGERELTRLRLQQSKHGSTALVGA